MIKKGFLILCAAAVVLSSGCSGKKSGSAKLKTDVDSVAYVIGMNVGMNLLRMDSTLNVAALCEGIRDVFEADARFSQADARAFYLRWVNYTLPDKARQYEEQFLADIQKSNRSYARTSSGVTYTVDVLGDQERTASTPRDSVSLRYVIRAADGAQIYSSYERGDTLRMTLGDLRSGVQESVRLIGQGGKIIAWLPAATAYGADGDQELGIRPNATLNYEIELIGVNTYANQVRNRNLR